jgi:hypothetical protein
MSTPSSPGTPDAPRSDTLATEVFDPAPPPSVATASTATAATTTATAPAPPEPTYLSGPAPFAVVLGLLGLLFAAATFLTQLTDLSLPWTDLGPWTVVAAGLVVVVVGAIGLRGSRTRD